MTAYDLQEFIRKGRTILAAVYTFRSMVKARLKVHCSELLKLLVLFTSAVSLQHADGFLILLFVLLRACLQLGWSDIDTL